MPVLPQEDPKELDDRIAQWLDDWRPRNAIERELVQRGARLSWRLERSERIEAAHLAHRVRLATRANPAKPKRSQLVNDLGRQLFYNYRKVLSFETQPPWVDEPAVVIARLEAWREGCQWLLDRWTEIRAVLQGKTECTRVDVHRFLRLMGKIGYEAVHDLELNAVFVAFDVARPGLAAKLWKEYQSHLPEHQLAFSGTATWRELGPRPVDLAQASAVIFHLIDDRIARLHDRIAAFDRIAELESVEAADLASFDPSPAFDRHRRQQASLGRELLRTVDSLRRLKGIDFEPINRADEADDQAQEEAEAPENATNEPKMECTEGVVIEEVKSNVCNDEDDERSQIAPAEAQEIEVANFAPMPVVKYPSRESVYRSPFDEIAAEERERARELESRGEREETTGEPAPQESDGLCSEASASTLSFER